MAHHVRQNRAPDTSYMTFRQIHSRRSVAQHGDLVTDSDIGESPVTRWIAYAIDYDDITSNAAADAHVINLTVPRGTVVRDAMVRVDLAWTSESADDVDIGDSNDPDGYADGLNLSTSVGTTPVWHRDASAAYINKASDISAGVSGAQYYVSGGAVVVTFKTAFVSSPPTAGRAIVFLEVISYNEPQSSEWTNV
jgi:hypothetical protein